MFSFPILWATPVFGVYSRLSSNLHLPSPQTLSPSSYPSGAYLKAPEMNSHLYVPNHWYVVYNQSSTLGKFHRDMIAFSQHRTPSSMLLLCIQGMLTIPIYGGNKFEIYSSRYIRCYRMPNGLKLCICLLSPPALFYFNWPLSIAHTILEIYTIYIWNIL